MTTLTKCVSHTPHLFAISEVAYTQYTFCQDCEQNVERWYDDTDPERLPMWTEWRVR